jgi:hypothetical protein
MSSFKDFVAARKAKQKAAPAPKAPAPKASAPKAPAPKISAPKAAAVAALVAAAATAPAPDMLALPETPYLDNTQPKLAAALRAAGDPVALRNAEAWMETQAAPAAPPKPTPPPRSEKPTRVLLLCYANNFMYDRDRAKKVVWNWSSRATGAIVCTNALARSLSTWAELDVLCVDGEHQLYAAHYPDGAARFDDWEDLSILRGTPAAVDALVAESARSGEAMSAAGMDGGGRRRFKSAAWDVCVMATVDARLARLATTKLDAGTCFAFVHEQLGLPFGPWSKSFVDGVTKLTVDNMPAVHVLMRTGAREAAAKAALTADLRGVELLCTSAYCRAYVERHAGSDAVAHCCYAADYGLFDGAPIPRMAPFTYAAREWTPDGRGKVKETPHSYATFVSPCRAKGIDVLLALAAVLPDVPFLAVITKWTKEEDRARMKDVPNVRVSVGINHWSTAGPGYLQTPIPRSNRTRFP